MRIAAGAALGLAIVALTIGTGAAQESFTPEELIARAHAASGFDRRPENERETWLARVAGLEGTLETLRRGPDLASATTMGPLRTAHGTWHGQRWHQNENGETILDRAEPSQTERTIAQSVGHVREPVDAWQLTTTYASGHVTRTYYDARTFLNVRTERSVAGRTVHTAFDDFRTDARGHTRPWHYYGGDDRAENAYEYRLQRDDTSAEIADAEIAVPHDRRTLVEFPAGVETVRLPARIQNDRIYVRLEIARRGLDFLLDTGAATLTIDQSVARQLGLTIRGRATQMVAGSFETGRVIVPSIAVGPLTMRDVVMRTAPFASHEAQGTRIVGLLGFDFLAAVALRIDYAGGIVEAMRPGTLVAPVGATPLDIRLNSGTPVTRATIGDATGDDFIIDTGAAFPYVVFQRFARAHPEAIRAAGDGHTSFGSGVGGSMPYRAVGSKRLALGTWLVDDVPGVEALAPNALGFDNEDGLIGATILNKFTVSLDYAAGRLYLQPNGRATVVDAASRTVHR